MTFLNSFFYLLHFIAMAEYLDNLLYSFLDASNEADIVPSEMQFFVLPNNLDLIGNLISVARLYRSD